MSTENTPPKKHNIVLEIDGVRHSTEDYFVISALQNLLVEHDVFDDGDILEVLLQDRDYILHEY